MTEDQPEYKTNGRTISKKKYYQMLTYLKDEARLADDEVERFGKFIQDIFAFDPDKIVRRYNEKNLESVRRYRERLKSEGVSTYISSGKKSSYEKKKIT